MSTTRTSYLAAYDAQLRTDAETPGALATMRLGPLWLATFPGGRGFVTYRHLRDADAATLAFWVGQTLDHFRSDPAIERVEWKTRGHDHAPGLDQTLVDHGFHPGEPESIMVGDAARLDVDVALARGLTLRRIEAEADVRAMCRMQGMVFGGPTSSRGAEDVLEHLARGDGMSLWVVEAGDDIVGAGRLEPVAGSEFASIWGGAVLAPWRGQGIYRALTAARAHAALAAGRTLVHSDSTAYSRPILERSGLVAVSTTTPYEWVRVLA